MKTSLSILTVNYLNVENDLSNVLPYIDYVHLDVMDGVFVPNISFGPAFVKSLRGVTDKVFDTHLMIENPINYIEQFASAGSDYITFHLEAKSDINDTIDLIHSHNVKAGLSIKPKTEVEDLIPYLDKIELVLVMSVEPGFGGQKFMPSSIDKIKWLADYRKKNNLNYLISVDGGINNETAKYVIEAGVDFAVVGSYILDKKNPVEKAKIIKNI